jgi:hypothetical protein
VGRVVINEHAHYHERFARQNKLGSADTTWEIRRLWLRLPDGRLTWFPTAIPDPRTLGTLLAQQVSS